MKTTKINKQLTQINTNVSSDQFDDLNELIKEEYLSDIIVTEEDNTVIVYCLTAEVKEVKEVVESCPPEPIAEKKIEVARRLRGWLPSWNGPLRQAS